MSTVQVSFADLHVHTCCSDGWPTPREVVDFVCRSTPLDLIAITDHDTIEGALWAADYAAGLAGDAPLIVVGEEVSTRDGHVLGLFLKQRIRPGMSAAVTVDQIHAQGGIAIAAHPFWRTERPSSPGKIHGVGWKAVDIDFDAIEVENATPGLYLYNQMAYRLQEQTLLAATGSSDAHILDAIGRAYTEFPGEGEEGLRKAIVHGHTAALRVRYRAMGLVRYMAWGIDHHRQRRLTANA